jgi:hypothetical protein
MAPGPRGASVGLGGFTAEAGLGSPPAGALAAICCRFATSLWPVGNTCAGRPRLAGFTGWQHRQQTLFEKEITMSKRNRARTKPPIVEAPASDAPPQLEASADAERNEQEIEAEPDQEQVEQPIETPPSEETEIEEPPADEQEETEIEEPPSDEEEIEDEQEDEDEPQPVDEEPKSKSRSANDKRKIVKCADFKPFRESDKNMLLRWYRLIEDGMTVADFEKEYLATRRKPGSFPGVLKNFLRRGAIRIKA